MRSALREGARLAAAVAGAVLLAAAPLDQAARDALVTTQQARATARQGQVQSSKGAVAARQRAAAAAAALPGLARRVADSRRRLEAAERAYAAANRAQAARRQAIAVRQRGSVEMVAALQTMARQPPALALLQPGGAVQAAHTLIALDAAAPAIRARTAALRAEAAAAEPLRLRLLEARDTREREALRLARDEAALSAAGRGAARQASVLQGRAQAETRREAGAAADAASLGELVDRLGTAPGRTPPPRLRPPAPGVATLVEADPLLPLSLSFAPGAGQGVVAPAAGRVDYAGPFRSYGGVVIVDHGGGWRSILSGLAMTTVRAGAVVPGGAALGTAGTAPVRYELRRRGAAVDPRPYLPSGLATACRDDASFAHRSGRAKAPESRGSPCRVSS